MNNNQPNEWFPHERREHVFLEETLSLCAYRLDAISAKVDDLNARIDATTQVHADIAAILVDLKEMVENKRALTVGRKMLAWVAGLVIGAAALAHSWGDIVAAWRAMKL